MALEPIALGVTRPRLPLPEPPPPSRAAAEHGPALLPAFVAATVKPWPPVRDPGAFACALTRFRGAGALLDCGVHLALHGDRLGARRSLAQSVAVEPRGAHASIAALWLGEIALREDRWDEAVEAYRTALASEPSDETAHGAALGLAWVALLRGDVPASLQALAQALSAPATSPVLHMARLLEGVNLLLGDRYAEALVALDAVDPSRLPASLAEDRLFWRGVVLSRLGERARALETLDRFLNGTPSSHPLRADALLQTGRIALESGASGDAVRRFSVADQMGSRPEVRPHVQAGLVRSYLALGDTARVGETAQRLVRESPGDPLIAPTLLLIADAAMQGGAMAEGLGIYRQVLGRLAVDPSIEEYARYRLGEGLEKDGRVDEARQEYVRLRDSGRDEAIAQRAAYRLGLLALGAGDPAAARREGEALLRGGTVVELRESALLLAAEAAGREGDASRAAALYPSVLSEFPASPHAARSRLGLGWARLADGDPELALRDWRLVVQTGDPDSRALAGLAIAEVAIREGRNAEALEALRMVRGLLVPGALLDMVTIDHGILAVRAGAAEEAVRVLEPVPPTVADPARHALVRRALGIARYKLGQHDLAEQELRRAVALVPMDPSNWLVIGMSALAQRRLVEAGEAFRRARENADPVTATSAAYGLIVVALQQGDGAAFRERATAFVDANSSSDATPTLLCALAMDSLARNEIERAEGWVSRLARDHPDSARVREVLVPFDAAASGQPALRRRAYQAILGRPVPGPLRVDAWFGLEEAALALGDAPEAQRAAEAFLREAPGADSRIPTARARLVRIHEMQGRHGLAIRTADAFIARFPDDALVPCVELIRGRLLVAAGQWESAQSSLESARACGERPVAAEAYFWLGEALRARGETDAAIAAYLGASTHYPETMWAARGLQGAARSYLARNMLQEAVTLLRELVVQPAAEPALAEWARDGLRRLGAEPPPSK